VKTGEVTEVVPDKEGRLAIGLWFRGRRLYVAGGPSLFVYNVGDGGGREVAACTVEGAGFINDVVTLGRKAYFSDSFTNFVYALDLEKPSACVIEKIPLSDIFEPEPGTFKANGIVAYRGGLLLAQSSRGTIVFIDLVNGGKESVVIPAGEALNTDGMVRDGNTLYLVQNAREEIGVWTLKIAEDRTVSAEKRAVLLSPLFRFPTTGAIFKDFLYVVNARFDEIAPFEGSPDDEFEAVGINRFLQ